MKIETHLPAEIVGFEYRKNHHWLKLKNDKGQEIKLNATGVLVGQCTVCDAMVLAFSNMGNMVCTHCQSPVKWQWTKPQLSFVPETESDFIAMMTVHNETIQKATEVLEQVTAVLDEGKKAD